MGWSSATELFDAAVEVALEFVPKIPEALSENEYNTPEIIVKAVVSEMYRKVNWEDWDTQEESKFFDKYLIHLLHEDGQLDDGYYEWHQAGKPDVDWWDED